VTGAENQDTALTFERDAVGRIVKEAQGDHWISSTYDEFGSRTHLESSLGAKVVLTHNNMGQVSHLAGAQAGNKAWTAQMSYNALGQEELRKVSGGVISEWQYDSMGRVKSHRVGSNDRDSRRRKYDWDVNQRLKSITDDLNNKRTTFSYDQFSNLVKADYGFGDILSRESDDVGNLYEKADKSDRIYGKGSRLEKSKVNTNELKNQFQGGRGKLVTEGVEYSYDGEGNLIKKAEPNGNITKYDYYGNGMLKEVTKPDGETVSFKYDSLGRRIEKSSDSNIIKFVWDGNNPLHEWEEENRQESLTTWIFDEGSFVPSAKMTNQGNYSIITDHLGTPVEAYDEDGEKVWEQELDIYGRVKPRPVVKEWGQVVDDGMFGEHFIPFRYQGQYSDEETGLYYNRHRYYSPELGQYITQDPIGLEGGNPTFYAYVMNPNNQTDPFGLAPWENGGFDNWFNNATPAQVQKHIQSVKAQLRQSGGFHEKFPVSLASKARQLGFTAQELKRMTVSLNGDKRVFFENVLDKKGNLHSGPHSTGKARLPGESGKASSNFHKNLEKDLLASKTKREAKRVINKHHNKHMRMRCRG